MKKYRRFLEISWVDETTREVNSITIRFWDRKKLYEIIKAHRTVFLVNKDPNL
jgi:hypothetical protein